MHPPGGGLYGAVTRAAGGSGLLAHSTQLAGVTATGVAAAWAAGDNASDCGDVFNTTTTTTVAAAAGGGGTVTDILATAALGVLLGSLCLLTLVGNVFVLHAVKTERRLQTVSNMFIVSLAIADLVVGVTVMPIGAVYIFSDRWLFGLGLCQFWLAVDYIASTASILNLFILSVDRYWSVTSPLQYIHRRTRRRAFVMISVAWFVSSLWIVPILSWHHLMHGGVRTVAADVCDTEYATSTLLKVVTATLNYYLPLAVMYGIYTKIFMEIRKRSKFEIGMRISRSMLRDSSRFASMTENNADVRRRRPPGELVVDECHMTHSEAALSLQEHAGQDVHKDADDSDQTLLPTRCPDARCYQLCPDGVGADGAAGDGCSRCSHSSGDERRPLNINSTADEAAAGPATTSPPSHQPLAARFSQQPRAADSPTAAAAAAGSKGRSAIWRRAVVWRLRTQRHKHAQSSALTREIKAAKQLGVIMGAFTLCFFPYFVCFLVVSFCVECVDPNLMTAVTWIGYLNSTMNPFLYPLCNKTFRVKFRKMLRMDTSSRYSMQTNVNTRYVPPRPSPLRHTCK